LCQRVASENGDHVDRARTAINLRTTANIVRVLSRVDGLVLGRKRFEHDRNVTAALKPLSSFL
ncbi:hypothetical protein, partial [Pseudomonas viridiflava]|uniref:hypothetical protein n=1 Tax=Pseudomonas viridiflava TaxID=33069 RepID=UPI0013DFFECD